MRVELLTEHHLVFLSLKGGCTDLPESSLVKMPHCWKSCVAAQVFYSILCYESNFNFQRLTYEVLAQLPNLCQREGISCLCSRDPISDT